MLAPLPSAVDVLIAGGGPAGLATAHALCAACPGARVLVAHRDAQIGLPVRTSGGSWLLRLRELGLPDHLHHPIDELVFASPGALCRTRFGEDRPVVLDVTATYQYLADLARGAGAQIITGANVTSVQRSRAGFEATIATASGDHTVRAAFVVDATGVARTVLSHLGVLPRFARLGIGAEYEFMDKSTGAQRATAALFVGTRYAPAGYGWVFPCPGGKVRVGVGVIKPDVDVHPRPLLDEFLAGDEPARLGLRLGPLVARHFGVIPAANAPAQSVFGRAIAVGDTACHALPLVGEGIRYCIEAGRVLGACLAEALHDPDRESAALAAYQSWWDSAHRATFDRAQQANHKMCRFTDAQWDAATRFLGSMRGSDLALALRMEMPALGWLRCAIRRPRAVVQFLARCKGAP